MPASVSHRAKRSSFFDAPCRCQSLRRPMLTCSSTSWPACQKKRYGEMVVPRSATRMPMYAGSSWMVGMNVPRSTSPTFGRESSAAPT